MQDVHHVAESTDARKNKLFSRQDLLCIRNRLNGLPQAFDGVDDASDIARAVVQQSDHVVLAPLKKENTARFFTSESGRIQGEDFGFSSLELVWDLIFGAWNFLNLGWARHSDIGNHFSPLAPAN